MLSKEIAHVSVLGNLHAFHSFQTECLLSTNFIQILCPSSRWNVGMSAGLQSQQSGG